MNPSSHRALAATSLASTLALLLPVSAEAQTTFRAEDTARGVTVLTRQRPEFDPLGVRLPGFRLDASVDAGVGYDDNLVPGQGEKRTGAFAQQQLAVSGATTWSRHALGVTASQATRQYFQDSGLNWLDYSAGAFGRYDIGRASSLQFRYDHIRSHYETDNFEVQQEGSRVPIPFDTDIFQVGGTAAFNRVRLGTTVDYRLQRYQDVQVRNVRDITSVNDHDILLGEFTADYAFVPGRYVLALVRLQDITYREASQSGRDSFTWEAQGGLQYDLTGLWQGRFVAGYRNRNYEQPGLKSLSGAAFEGQITYVPTQLTTFSLGLSRTIEESIRESSVSFTRTAARLTVDHELLRNVIVSGEIRAERRQYPRGVGTVSDGIALVQARWSLNRNIALIGLYQHTERLEAPNGVSEYGRNQVQLRLRFSL
ncbi:outer membrane beta-barrel protein [Roseomonas sp. GCM10028921]